MVLEALRAEKGSVLAFLPGAGEIRRTETFLRERISDPATDVALLQIDARGLTAVPLGDSDRLEVGDVVIAIGICQFLGLRDEVQCPAIHRLSGSRSQIERFQEFQHLRDGQPAR